MRNSILIAGSTGNLGGKITDSLLAKGANVCAIVRKETDQVKIQELVNKGVKVFQVDMHDKDEIANVCSEVSCVVSALSGLRDIIIDTQKILLYGAIQAGVHRFIPSDYSIDFNSLIHGTNRNLDLRREFHKYLKDAPIKVTTIFNGVFMDLLITDMPLILSKFNRILYWGDPKVKMDMTTTYNIAEFTANAALDNDSPRYLRVAGDTVNAVDMAEILTQVTNKKYKLFRAGSLDRLNTIIKIAKFFSKDTKELYPAWQGMQYMRDMMEGRAVINSHDNNRYKDINWTNVKEFLIKNGVS